MKSIKIKLQALFQEKAVNGIYELRWSELKQWARKEHFSPSTLGKALSNMVNWKHLIRNEKVVNRRLAVFYAWNPDYRERFLEAMYQLRENLKEIDGLSNGEKLKELNDYLTSMSDRFADFVPFYIHHLLQNKGKIKDAEEELEALWHWALYPNILLLAEVCNRNSSETWQLPIIQDMEKGFKEFQALRKPRTS